MPKFDFDSPIDRRGEPGDKWGRYAGRDVLPLWVADMDFAAPAAVIDALHRRVDHRVFGYTDAWPGLVDAAVGAIERDHAWRIEAEWLVWLPGVVAGLNLACRAVGEPGDEVFTATPVYPPFLTAPGNSDRRLVTRRLEFVGGRWEWDRAAVEAALSARSRLLMLCNPHNPVGRVFDRDELEWLAELAARHNLAICSDEIHCGLVLDRDAAHVPIAALDEATARRTITLMAPSKTWNIPGLYCAFAVIPDAGLRRHFRHAMRGLVPHPNLLGMVAAEAAYRDGGPWRAALLAYLRGNLDLVMDALATMPGLAAARPQATYLVWIDCRGTGLADPVKFFEAAGVGLSDGAPFGMPGFVRLNFGCTRALLVQALERMRRALSAR